MSTLQGNAKRYNGEPVDYVLIFDWVTGECIGKSVPNSSGVWTFDYFKSLLCGITYVADGCEPITHGAYSFDYTYVSITSGYLLVAMASSGDFYISRYDVNNTTTGTWQEKFAQTAGIGLHNYTNSVGKADTPYEQKTINHFELDWVLNIRGINSVSGEHTHLWTLELLDANDNVVAAIKSEKDGNGSTGLWYGESLTSMTKTGKTGTSVSTNGDLSFTSAGISYQNVSSSNYNNSFNFNVNLSAVVKIRVAGSAHSERTSPGTYTGGSIEVLSPTPVQ